MSDFDTRVAAYGVIVEEGKVLLAHANSRGAPDWTLPGGGLEAGEDAETAACREVFEETGFRVTLEELLGVDSRHFPAEAGRRPFHWFRILYCARISGGDLRHEVGGTTDEARWFDLNEIEKLNRESLVDVGLRLWKEKQTPPPEPGNVLPEATEAEGAN